MEFVGNYWNVEFSAIVHLDSEKKPEMFCTLN